MERYPSTPCVLVLVTHLVMTMFAKQHFESFKAEHRRPPSPMLFICMVGKFFMCVRLVMSYSSGILAMTLNFFIVQEFILTIMHAVCAATVFPCIHDDPVSIHDMVWVIRATLLVDIIKTICTYIFWLHFKPGWIAYTFNRLPTLTSQIEVAFLVHLVMDIIQSTTTVFTLYIARFFRSMGHGSAHHEDHPNDSDEEASSVQSNEEGSRLELKFLEFNVLALDMWWCRHLFLYQNKYPNVRRNAMTEMKRVLKAYGRKP